MLQLPEKAVTSLRCDGSYYHHLFGVKRTNEPPAGAAAECEATVASESVRQLPATPAVRGERRDQRPRGPKSTVTDVHTNSEMPSTGQIQNPSTAQPSFKDQVPRCMMVGCSCSCYEWFPYGDTDDECTCGHPKSKHAF